MIWIIVLIPRDTDVGLLALGHIIAIYLDYRSTT